MKTIKTLDIPKKGKVRRKNLRTIHKLVTDNLGKSDTNSLSQQSETSLVYGVLGIGRLGSTFVINLIKLKKKVYIWNRTNEKCMKLLQELDSVGSSYVKICHIPALVLKMSDIVFNCISDSQGSMEIIERSLSKELATDNFMEGKGLVDMSGIDPDSQKKLFTLVEKKGGQYLEVRIQIKNQFIGGGYLFIVGGSADLFQLCKNVFTVLGARSVYLKQEIGYVTTLNLSLQLMKSVYLMGITEGCSLLERMIPLDAQHKLLSMFFTTPLFSDYIKSKIVMIFEKNFGVEEQSLQNLEKDVRMGLNLSEKVSEPMCLSSGAVEIFKHCQKLGYGELDPSAVFMRIRH